MKSNQVYDYKREEKKKFRKITIGAILLFIIFILDIMTGTSNIPIGDIFLAIFKPMEVPIKTLVIIKDLRFPKSSMAILSGFTLGFSGGIMQTILNNRLASPYTLGLSSAAGFGAAFAIVTGISTIVGVGIYLIPLCAFIFTFIACFLIYMFSHYIDTRPGTMILGGIGFAFLFGALQTLLQYIATPEESQNIVFWLFGSLSRSNWLTISITFITLGICVPIIMKHSWELTTLKLGEENAEGLGINVKRLRVKCFVVISLITGVTVAFVGTIGFVGLVGPHVARLIIGEDQRFFLPASGLFGASLLTFASFISKNIVPGNVFPIGIITSLIGVPFYFFLIFSKRKEIINARN